MTEGDYVARLDPAASLTPPPRSGCRRFATGCGLLFLALVVAVVGAGWYFYSHRLEYLQKGAAITTEGQTFGRTARESQCVDRALADYQRQRNIVNGLRSALWIDGCLETSTVEASFCEGVPNPADTGAIEQWQKAQCIKANIEPDTGCRSVLTSVARYCEKPAERKTKAGSR